MGWWLRVTKGGMLWGKGPFGWFQERGQSCLGEMGNVENRDTGDGIPG